MGYPQKQSAIITTFVLGTNGSAMMFFVGKDLQVPFMHRLFVDPNFSFGKFEELRAFIQGNPSYTDQIAGSNDSSKDNFLEGDGWDSRITPMSAIQEELEEFFAAIESVDPDGRRRTTRR